jgi:hypothetical protein
VVFEQIKAENIIFPCWNEITKARGTRLSSADVTRRHTVPARCCTAPNYTKALQIPIALATCTPQEEETLGAGIRDMNTPEIDDRRDGRPPPAAFQFWDYSSSHSCSGAKWEKPRALLLVILRRRSNPGENVEPQRSPDSSVSHNARQSFAC